MKATKDASEIFKQAFTGGESYSDGLYLASVSHPRPLWGRIKDFILNVLTFGIYGRVKHLEWLMEYRLDNIEDALVNISNKLCEDC